MIWAFESDVGRRREENQDCCAAFCIDDAVFAVVADGMGGYSGGSEASRLAVECVKNTINQGYEPDMSDGELISLLISCYTISNAQILERSSKSAELNGMGTTMVLAALRKNRAVILNVGDSRAYFVSKEGVKQITKDQSYVQHLVDSGKISEQEAQNHPQKNVIMQAVGVELTIAPDVYEAEFSNEHILLCSDGLSNKLSHKQIATVIDDTALLPQEKVKKLIHMANEAGGEDNISAVLIMNN